MSAPRIRMASLADAPAVAAIYHHYVMQTPVTFETDPPDAAEFARRMALVLPRLPYLVAESDGRVAGYAYAHMFHARAAYRWVVETTVYVAHDAARRGIGRALYESLLERLTDAGFVSAIGVITLPNAASVGLHEAFGFAHVGTYDRVGHKLGAWHDVGLWQKQLAPRTDDPAEPHPAAG